MTGLCSRRTLLTIAGAAAVSSITAAHAADGKTSKPAKRTWPDMPTVPTDFNAERCFVELQDAGDGVVFQGPKNGPVVRLAFDTQCPWCVWQYEQLKPFLKQVTFIWHPVAVLNPWSELQGAATLSAKDRKAKFLEHEAHFHDKDFRGLDVRNVELPFDARKKVWDYSKAFRRACGISVPFGVLKTTDGRYIPVPQVTTEEFAKLSGLKPE